MRRTYFGTVLDSALYNGFAEKDNPINLNRCVRNSLFCGQGFVRFCPLSSRVLFYLRGEGRGAVSGKPSVSHKPLIKKYIL